MKEADFLAKFQSLDQLWDPADPLASEAAYQALPDAQTLPGRNRSFLIDLYSLFGRSEAFLGKFALARVSLENAENLLNEDLSVYQISARIRWLIERGRLYILEKTPSQAKGLFSEAWNLAVNSGEDYFAVEIAQLLATTEQQKAQQEWIVRAIEIAESSPLQKTKRWLGGLYSSLGWKLYDLRQYEKSLETFQKALRNLKAQGALREAFVAQWSIGKVLRA